MTFVLIRDMSKECKCEHWQQCPVCMPHRFDKNGHLLPPEPTPLQAARIRIEELERDLLNLVCRIHRDGGHYIAKYGEAKAIADADTVVAQNNADLDALQADNARLREVPVKHVAPYLGHKEVYDEVLASIPAQSLARLRNRVLDEAINVAWNNEPDCSGPIEMALRKLKEQP